MSNHSPTKIVKFLQGTRRHHHSTKSSTIHYSRRRLTHLILAAKTCSFHFLARRLACFTAQTNIVCRLRWIYDNLITFVVAGSMYVNVIIYHFGIYKFHQFSKHKIPKPPVFSWNVLVFAAKTWNALVFTAKVWKVRPKLELCWSSWREIECTTLHQ